MPLLEESAQRHGRRMRWVLLVIAAACLGFGALLALATFHPAPSLQERLFYVGVCVVCAGLFGHEGLRRPGLGAPGLRAIAERPSEIVWIYVFRSKRGASLVLATTDGDRLDVPIQGRRADDIMRDTAARLPHARTGYDPDTDATFRRDPGALRASRA